MLFRQQPFALLPILLPGAARAVYLEDTIFFTG
jgi:hypothetical protein